MRLISRVLIPAIVALACLALPSSASAVRIYYLVGVRHVYRIGTDKYFHASERKQIEEDYADEVSADNAHYQYQISHGSDPSTESVQLQSALHDLAAERERRLGALYEQCDWVRNDHPCFNIKVDGPYQVIGVDFHEHENVEVWDDYVCYAPWPGYTCVGPVPYGWSYGVVCTPGVFLNAYNGWYGGWIGFGSPAFVGFYGFGGPVVVAGLSVNIGLGFGVGMGFGGFYYNPGLGGFYHRGPGYFASDPFRGGYIASRRDPRAVMAGRAGYTAGAEAIRSARTAGYADGIRAGAHSSFASGMRRGGASSGATRSGYAHSTMGASSRQGGSFAHSGASARATSGYAHSATGASTRTRGASSTRTNTAVRRSSAGHGSSGYAHSAVSHGGTGSFARSNGSRASGMSRNRTVSTHSGSSMRSSGASHNSVRTRSSGGGRSMGGGGRSMGGGGRSMGGGGRSMGGGGRSMGGGGRSGGGGNRKGHGG